MSSRISRLSIPLARRRLATLEDAVAIFKLINESMAMNFRVAHVTDLNKLIVSSTLAIVQLNLENAVVGFLAAKDHPLLPSVHPSAWEHYIWTKYKTVDMNARNTLFIHLLCWEEVYGRELVDEMLKSLFMHDPYLMNVAFIKSIAKYPLLMPGYSRCEGSFKRVASVERGVPSEVLPVLCVAERSEVCPRLRVRRAVEEDNDDLVPIIDRHSTRLRELYGEFYISELIARHPESERVLLVGEHKELAVGVMILNTVINHQALEENFDLTPFAGLRHLDAKSKIGVQSTLGADLSSVFLIDTSASAPQISDYTDDGDDNFRDTDAKDKVDSRKKTLSWMSKEEKSFDDVPVSLQCIDKDEEIDFDIVNIDINLLKIPRSLSADLDIELGSTAELLKDGTKDFMPAINDKIDCMLKKASSSNNGRPVGSGVDSSGRRISQAQLRAGVRARRARQQVRHVPSDRNVCGSPQTSEVAHYTGPPNAFLLEVFAMHPDYDERYGFDILEAAYELFPDRDYCILCLPSNEPAFPLLEHFTLVAPKHRREKYTNQSLYVAHINSIRESVAVRRAEAFDFPAMRLVLEHVPFQQLVMQLLERSLVSDSLVAYALLSQHQPVGVIILGALDNDTAVRTQYDLLPEPRQPGGDGAILAGILSPALEPHARWYLRDVLRHSKYTHLFWRCQLMTKSYPSRNIMSLAGRMVPVAPHLSVPNITGNKDLDKIWNISTPFSLWGIENSLTALPKVDVNYGIVVVGASRTGLAFIETLLMGPASQYLTFTNVTLVSEHALPMAPDCLTAAEVCVPKNGRYTDRYLKSIPFYYYVDCITGVMKGIDRKKKCIHLKGGGVKYYDKLVLTCGQQFQHPEYLAESFEHVQKMKKNLPCERTLMNNPNYKPDRVPPLPELPENVFLINCLSEANICLRKLLHMISTATFDDRLTVENRVVVYGDCLQSYSTMAALLELGIPPGEIAFVEPFPPEDRTAMRINCFNNEIIDERAQTRIEELGIQVYRECRFVNWRMKGHRADRLEVMSPLHRIYIPCFAFFYYGLKAINWYAFKAISECGLVYDGGLVVDPSFKTNDPHVYGAGTSVQYSRRLHADQQSHRHYCSEDVGEALAKIFLHQMDPFVMADAQLDPGVLPRYRSSLLDHFPHPSIEPLTRPSLEKHRDWEPVIKFESPITSWAILPGPLYYLRLRRPGPDIPMEVELTLPHQGHLLTTDKDGNYFALRLNTLHCVESVTCLAKKPPPYDLLTQLYGVHEAMFNKLLVRYMMNKIEDFYEYFMQPWMSALYQETFGNLLRQICRQNVGTVFDLVKSHFALDMMRSEVVDDDWSKFELDFSKSVTSLLTCYSGPTCFGPQEAPNLGSVRSVIEGFIKGSSFIEECGQSESVRGEAKSFWMALRGDRVVTAHLARYLDCQHGPNPHYATIRPDRI